MGTTYEKAGAIINGIIEKVIKQNYPKLDDAKVTIDAIVAQRFNADGEAVVALRHDGRPVAAHIKITSLEDRARGLADAKLTIDDSQWFRLTGTQKVALIDHELAHLALSNIRATKKNGYATGLKRDDLGRPVLKIRPHDWVITGFAEVVDRHREDSIEAKQFLDFKAEYGTQLALFGPTVMSAMFAPAPNGHKQIEHTTNGKDGWCKRCQVGHHKDCKHENCACPKCAQVSIEA